jgi:leucyl-tRNA synthetase
VSLAFAPWPEYDEKYAREDTIELPVQINGRLRSRLILPATAVRDEVEASALADARVKKYLAGGTVRKVIVVPGKLVNIVVQ